jgi:hypothetical protein
MLREMKNVRQVPGDRFRRWFGDESLEVVVWYEPDGSIYGFQICYDPQDQPRAVTWTPARGLSHARVDSGESCVLENRTPMLRPGGICDTARLREVFLASGRGLPATERAFVASRLAESIPPA